MSEPDAPLTVGEPPANDRQHHGERRWTRTGVVAGVVAAVATVGAFALDSLDFFGGDDSEAATQPTSVAEPSPSPPPSATAEDLPAPEMTTPLTCRSAGEPVPCLQAHSYQVVGIDPAECDQPGLIAHMGGDPTLDVTRVAAGLESQGGTEVCVAKAGFEWQGYLVNALEGPDGDALRVCVSQGLDTSFVGCDEEHQTEIVGPPSTELTLAACEDLVERYTDVTTGRLDSRLRIEIRESSDGNRSCAISYTGGNRLTGSLRLIGSTALPTS